MTPNIGELIVGAYLRLVMRCDIVDYNFRSPGGGLQGLNELDVLGLSFDGGTAYLCEVSTHIRGLNATALRKIQEKAVTQRAYAENHLGHFPNRRFMFWAPVVTSRAAMTQLQQIDGLELVINQTYTQRITELRQLAREHAHDTGNDFFRVLQILERLR